MFDKFNFFIPDKNTDTYNDEVGKTPNNPAIVARALICTNNGNMLRRFDADMLQKANTVLLKTTGQSLLCLALQWGDMSAVRAIVEHVADIPSDRTSLQQYLLNLFTRVPLCSRYPDEDISYDKSSENLVNIYHYLIQHIAIDVREDLAFMDNLLLEAAKNSQIDSISILLELGSNVNAEDEMGHTALYYLMSENKTAPIIEKLRELGAKLSQADAKGLAQPDFAVAVIKAITSGNREDINNYLIQINKDDCVLSIIGFNECVEAAVAKNDIVTVISLLSSKYAGQTKLDVLLNKLNTLISDEMKYAIAEACHTKFNTADSFNRKLVAYAHRIGIEGSLAVDTDDELSKPLADAVTLHLEGESIMGSRSQLNRVLTDYSAENKAFKSIAGAVSFAANLDLFTGDNTGQSNASFLAHRYYSKGHGMLLVSGWGNHAIGISLKYDIQSNKTYVALANRGDGHLAACATTRTKEAFADQSSFGTVVYALDGKLDQLFFDEFVSFGEARLTGLGLIDSRCKDKIISRNETGFTRIVNQHLGDAKMIAVLPAEPQGNGTCSYVNPKRAIEGLLLIEAICAGSPVDKTTMDAAYDQYKLFSIYDKQQAAHDLIALYRAMAKNPNVNPLEVDLLTRFIVNIILKHNSMKYGRAEFAWTRELFNVLPKDQQEQLSSIRPELISTTKEEKISFFSHHRDRVRDIKIIGELNDIVRNDAIIKKLIDFLRAKGVDRNVKKIKIIGDNITVFTKTSGNVSRDRDVKYNLRDNIFKAELNANIKNIDGKYEFIVNNVNQLIIPNIQSSPHMNNW